jgi:hypothetical protein
MIPIQILSNGDIDHAVALSHAFLSLSASLNFPHKQVMHFPLRDTYYFAKIQRRTCKLHQKEPGFVSL